jgi:ribosomal-protein-alanine N-acetyltransferase
VRLERPTARRRAEFLAAVRRRSHVGHLICRRDTGEIVGGVFRSGYLGYYAFVPHAGHGLLREGLALVITEAFRRRRLHRLEANIQPANRRSVRLVRGLGFRREGFSPRYLEIFGRWRDHERWAILTEAWRARR